MTTGLASESRHKGFMIDALYSTQGPCNLKVNVILEGTALFYAVVSWCKCMALCISYFKTYFFVWFI